MKVIRSIQEFLKVRDGIKSSAIGFVPTMGALHAGHRSLFERSKKEDEVTIASIFVNPTQFNDPKDLKNYPSTYDEDVQMLKEVGVDYLLYPTFDEVYPDQYRYVISEKKLSLNLCGASRPGHFDGVLSVVMKLFNIVRPHRAYFGEKDFQQLTLIKDMTTAFFMNIDVIPCPIVREKDGLAMSSRNMRLSPSERKLAPRFYEILSSPKGLAQIRGSLEESGFKVDYVEDVGSRRYGAVFLGNVRLIDNVEIKNTF